MTDVDTVPSFAGYAPAQREKLRAVAGSPAWRRILARTDVLAEWRAQMRTPAASPGQQAMAGNYLKARNGPHVREMVRRGVRDEAALLAALGDWESALAGDERFPIAFLGLVVTLDCHFLPRCLYCNQAWLPRALTIEDWKAVLREAAEPTPPYVYLTGGEPLILGSEVWGDNGLVAFAAGLGCAVNINTNAALITPQVALQLVRVGLARLHISLDSANPEVQADLFQGAARVDAVWRGINNVLVAREVLGADHPQIHVNCVLTARNLFGFPDLLRALLDVRKRRTEGHAGKVTGDPAFRDFAFHLIPVGGSENALIRPTAAEWKRFYTETWAEAERIWSDYQADLGVPEADRKTLARHVPFASPYLRADHRMRLDEYLLARREGQLLAGRADRALLRGADAGVCPAGRVRALVRRPRHPPAGAAGRRARVGPARLHPREPAAPARVPQRVLQQLRRRDLRHQPGHGARAQGTDRALAERARRLTRCRDRTYCSAWPTTRACTWAPTAARG